MDVTRVSLVVGDRVQLPDKRRGTIAPTSAKVPAGGVNVMLDVTGMVTTVRVQTLLMVNRVNAEQR